MKALIVGCTGMLGSDLIQTFAPRLSIVGLDLPDLDITNAEQCLARVKEVRPDIILNAAALTDVDYCETHEEKAFSINGRGAGNLAEAATAASALLVHFSTDYVFDGRKAEPYREQDSPNPQSIYGKSKLQGEEFVRSRCQNHLILRTAWLFGCHGKNFIRTIIGAARKGQPLRVVNDQRGSPTYSYDLASQTLQMVIAGCRGSYHVTNSGSCTWYELAVRTILWADIKGVDVTPVRTAEFPRPAPRPANSILANTRLKQERLPLMRSWQEAAQEYVLGATSST